jgi:KDO2-lipid IV(A) lauroyltransferase
MRRLLLRTRAILRDALKPVTGAIVGAIAVGLLRATSLLRSRQDCEFLGSVTRTVGPWLREHKIGHANLTAAFPEKSSAEIDAILMGVWDNLGRVGAEFAHLDHIWKLDPEHWDASRVEPAPGTSKIRNAEGRWQGRTDFREPPRQLGAAGARRSRLRPGIGGTVCRPNIAAVDRAVQDIRSVNMGTMVATTHDAPLRLAQALQAGVHVGMLVDQHFGRGVDVTFFGPYRQSQSPARAAGTSGRGPHPWRAHHPPPQSSLPRRIVGRGEAHSRCRGKIDVQATTQAINSVIEGWVREHPEQWLWLHRRWR